ncbi:MAG: helix-turn-helix domain-containing protein [Lachnospiraceae bacterium]
MAYTGVLLNNSITVEKIFSIHYFEYMSNFSFEGETHDFWEFICVDKGEVSVTAGKTCTILKKGDIAFHQPNEFHNVKATGQIAPNLVVISFECHDEAMNFFRNGLFKIDETERNLLANIIVEAKHCFDCRLDDPYLQNMTKKEGDVFGSEQMVRLYLEYLLIHLIRRYQSPFDVQRKNLKSAISKVSRDKNNTELFNQVTDYLTSHLREHITIEQICHDNLIGRSQLQKIFKEKTGLGIIEYFSHMKIEAAKELIRTNRMNFTQISEHLGYTSIHYFSRQFKKLTGMTPSEYASSIKAVAERGF